MADNQELLVYSPSPHIKKPITTRRIMIDVCIALLPAAIMGVVYFGLKALLLLVLSVVSAVASEAIYLLAERKTISEIIKKFDFSSCVTGLLLGLTVGTNYPWYSVILGAAFSVVVVKMLFGGTGKNLVNPAITGRIFIFMSFQSVVGKWALPRIASVAGGSVETGATIIESIMKGSIPTLSNLDLLLGTGLPGCIGETCKVALILGGIYLVYRKIINPVYPVIYVGVAGLFAVALKDFDFNYFALDFIRRSDYRRDIYGNRLHDHPKHQARQYHLFRLPRASDGRTQRSHGYGSYFVCDIAYESSRSAFDKFIVNKPFGYEKKKKVKGGAQ